MTAPAIDEVIVLGVAEMDCAGRHRNCGVRAMTPAEVRAWRMSRGLTQAQAARLTGVTVGTWTHYEYAGEDRRYRRTPPPYWRNYLRLIDGETDHDHEGGGRRGDSGS